MRSCIWLSVFVLFVSPFRSAADEKMDSLSDSELARLGSMVSRLGKPMSRSSQLVRFALRKDVRTELGLTDAQVKKLNPKTLPVFEHLGIHDPRTLLSLKEEEINGVKTKVQAEVMRRNASQEQLFASVLDSKQMQRFKQLRLQHQLYTMGSLPIVAAELPLDALSQLQEAIREAEHKLKLEMAGLRRQLYSEAFRVTAGEFEKELKGKEFVFTEDNPYSPSAALPISIEKREERTSRRRTDETSQNRPRKSISQQ